ncbi:MAG: McrC family protein [Anaerolineaceae bacterium]|nr:McrC family protein [Anaerolineaceae bacterium]
MRESIEIKEFTRIFCKDDVQDEGLTTVSRALFEDLEQFLFDFKSSNIHADASEFIRLGSQRYAGKYISVNNFVGVIQTPKGHQVQILPKIDLGSDENDADEINSFTQTKKIFLKMIRSLRDLPIKHLDTTNLRTDKLPIFEIFISMYLQEAMILAKRGLKSAYLEHEDNLRFYKGKLMVSEHIKRNTAHKERFYMRYDEYDLNRPENRLIKSTLLKLMSLSTNEQNQKEIRQILTFFELVEPSPNYERDFSLVKKDRTVKDYEMILQWSKVFLLNQSFSTFTGRSQSWALLFPMETVFESYVAQELRRVCADTPWTISVQDREQWLFDYPNHKFRLKPDIVIRKDDGSQIILDTKWKSLTDNERMNYGISQSDMYQMYAYSKKYARAGGDSPDVWLLYPVNSEMRKYTNDRTIEFISKDAGEKEVHVRLFFVDLKEISQSMQSLKTRLEIRQP